MIKAAFDKIDKLGPYLYLLGPFIFFTGYFNGVKFVSFPAIASVLGLIIIIPIVARNSSTKNFTITPIDYLIFTLSIYFLATAFLSEHTLLSLKRWVLVMALGGAFYALGRLIPNPINYIKKSDILCAISILILLSFAFVIYIFGQTYKELGLPKGEFTFMDAIPIFDNIYVGQTYGGRYIGNFFLYRPSSLFSNPNGVALFAMLSLSITVYNWEKRSFWRWLILLATVILLLWTASRAALLGSAVFLLSYQFCTNSRLRRLTPILIGVVIILPLALYIFTLIFPQPDRWDNYFEILQLRERGSGWKIALESFTSELWLTGAGFGVVQEAVLGPNDFVFSIWIVLLLETGIIGVSLVFLVWTMSLKRCFSSIRECKEGSQVQKVNAVIFSLLLALLFHQAFDLSAFRFHPLNFFLFSLFGLAANPKLTTVEPSE